MCAHTHRHTNFKIMWSDFSTLPMFLPVHKVKFCLWCQHCAAWPNMWNGEGRIYRTQSCLLHEILTQWLGNLNQQSFCLPNAFIHRCHLALRKSCCSPWCASLKQHSCQVHWGDSFLDAGVTQCLKSYRNATCWHFPVWSRSHSPLLSGLKWMFHCIQSQM